MASPSVDISHGFTIAFGTSSFTAEITDITPPGLSRDAVNTSHQGTEDYETYLAAPLANPGQLEFTIHLNPDNAPPMTADPEQITVTFPSGATWVFSGFMTDYSPNAPHKDKMTADITVQVNGEVTITAAGAE